MPDYYLIAAHVSQVAHKGGPVTPLEGAYIIIGAVALLWLAVIIFGHKANQARRSR